MGAYREFVRIPGVAPLLVAATFPRLAYSMVSLAMFFQVQSVTGSVGTAGLAVGVSSGLGALTAGPRGHLVDRFGQTMPLYSLVPAYAVACLLLAFLATDSWTVVALSGLVGLTAPPINLSIRPLWIDIVGVERVRMAYSTDTGYTSLIQLLGPVAATLIALHACPRAAMAAVAVFMLLGGLLLAANRHSRSWVPEPKEHGEQGMLGSGAIRLLALEGIAMGLAMGFVTRARARPASTSAVARSMDWIVAFAFAVSGVPGRAGRTSATAMTGRAVAKARGAPAGASTSAIGIVNPSFVLQSVAARRLYFLTRCQTGLLPTVFHCHNILGCRHLNA